MKVLVLNGSPKKRSDTFRLTDAFLKGLNKTKEHEVNIIHVIERASEEYAANLTLSAETIAALETPMIPKEEYIRQVNGGT